MTYASYYSKHGRHMLEIDQYNNCLQIGLLRQKDSQQIVGEFTLAEAEEIAASIAHVCRQIRVHRAKLKPRPPEGNPFPKSYRQHALWERDHEPE